MFTFEKRDEGFMVFNAEGRGVAHVEAAVITLDHNPKFKEPERARTVLPREKWTVHFTSIKLTIGELSGLVEALSKQEA